jgi:hypothetical protein
MAVWERFEEEASGGSKQSSRKKKTRRAILGELSFCSKKKKLGRRELSHVSNLPLHLTES